MTTTTTFQKVDDIFQCKLMLEDDTEYLIPLRDDGYIHATQLCKVAKKRLDNWRKSSETKALINKLILTHSEGTKIIEVYQAGNKYSQGTWVHPDLGIHLAQWCNPNFSLQVSKWIKELIFTGSVEIGKEKDNDEIVNELKKQLEDAQQVISSIEQEKKYLSCQYNRIQANHRAFLRRKELYKLKEGNCVYLVDMIGLRSDKKEDEYEIKVGNTGKITDRVSGYRTSSPFCKVLYVMYTPHNIVIEGNMKVKYENELKLNNREFISNIKPEDLIKSLHMFADMLNSPFTIETEEELEKFNSHVVEIDETEEDKDIFDNTMKRCGGITHTTEEERILPLSNFFKNASNKDGFARLCKECYLTGEYGDKRKRRKVVIVPEFDKTTHKWCNRCESVKEHDKFYKSTDTKDGLSPNCKECKKDQKNKRKLIIKETKS